MYLAPAHPHHKAEKSNLFESSGGPFHHDLTTVTKLNSLNSIYSCLGCTKSSHACLPLLASVVESPGQSCLLCYYWRTPAGIIQATSSSTLFSHQQLFDSAARTSSLPPPAAKPGGSSTRLPSPRLLPSSKCKDHLRNSAITEEEQSSQVVCLVYANFACLCGLCCNSEAPQDQVIGESNSATSKRAYFEYYSCR